MGSTGAIKNTPSTTTPAPEPPRKTLYSKDQVDSLTKDYTPEMFLGDIKNTWTGTLNDLRNAADEHAPKTLELGGYTFERLGNTYVDFEQTSKTNGWDIAKIEYQSNEQVGQEYPVLQVGIRVRRYRGKVVAEIIRDGYTNKTRFW